MLSANTILQDRYQVLRELGHGGMGTVYEALDQRVNCIVALKETSAKSNDDKARRAFEREAALLGNLRHSSLPKVMDYFSQGEADFLVMEFIPGYDLAELMELRDNPFSQAQVMRWADELLKVLEYLHKQSPPVLHRDIKPSNLKLTKQGEIFLIDFGLAKGVAGQMSTLTTSRSVRGYTAVYAPLEQIHGHGTDPRSDLYSLAATLYHLLTAIPPVDAPKRFSVLEDGQPDPLQPIEKLNSEVSANVGSVIHRAMAINRRQRPASAAEMRKALRNAIEEDEQHAAEEEYRRAEEARQGRTDERHFAADEVAHNSEEERQLQAAETRELEEERRRKAEQRERAAEEHSAKQQPKPPAVETPKAAARARIFRVGKDATDESRGIATMVESSTEKSARYRSAMIVAAVLISFLALVLIGWFVADRNRGQTSKKTGIELVQIPAGSFTMGSTDGDADERPVHQVTISQAFYMGKYEVTQAQWQALMGNNPSYFKDCGGNCPVEQVSWEDAQNFINKLNESNDGFSYRLPSEAEWEYACRAGTTGDYAGNLSEMAWYSDNSGNRTHAVGQKQQNGWGLADMHGNVWEWCQDWYHETYYEAPTDGSAWLNGGEQKVRVLRGGSWPFDATISRSANRSYDSQVMRTFNRGFRVAAVKRT